MKRILVYILLCTLSAGLNTALYAKRCMNELSSSLVRLHIIAASDSDEDQNIKLAVRDEVLKAVEGYSAKADKEEFLAAAETAAQKYLDEHNIAYTANAQFGKFYFPRKSYGGITLPAGEYNGIRVVLGAGGGHNWWCVMYPPMCVTGSGEVKPSRRTEKMLKKEMSGGTYKLISNNVEVKLKIVELLSR